MLVGAVIFVLPQNGLNGVYTLRSDYGNVQYYNFTVEEYKRPTFGVEIEKAASRYAAGDTVRLAAKAKSFAGVPVQGAKVEVKVVRRPSFFWRCASTDARTETVYRLASRSVSVMVCCFCVSACWSAP